MSYTQEEFTKALQEIKIADVTKPVELGLVFGILRPGFSLEDYLVEAAITEAGYETVLIWGLQGSGKSTRMLQMLFWIYRAVFIIQWGILNPGDFKRTPDFVDQCWEIELTPAQETEIWLKVLDSIIFRPNDFVATLEEVPDDEVMPVLGWDDIGVHYPSSKFKTDLAQYEAIDSTWAAIRTKLHVVITTIPVVNRLAKNVRDNVTFEVFLGKNQMEKINRCFWLPGTRSIEANYFKAILEKGARFQLKRAPLWVWEAYWKKRITLTKEALASLRQSTDMASMENYLWVVDAAAICHAQGIKYATGTIQQDISRGVLRGEKIGGRLCVHIDDFIKNVLTKGAEEDIIMDQIAEIEKGTATPRE